MTERTVETEHGRGLRGSIGVAGIVFMVVAAAAPLTSIGGALPVMLSISNGPGVPVAYAIVASVLLVFSVGYAAMSYHVVDAGAFYAYVTKGLGPTIGLGAAGLALLTYTAIQAAIYGLAAATLQELITRYGGPEVPWWALAGLLLVVVAALGYRNIEIGAKVLGVMLVLEIAIVAALAVAILVQGGPEGYSATSFSPATFFQGAPGVAVTFAVASFVGFEATAIYGEESRNPKRTIPIATYVAVVLIGAFYTFSSWTIVVAHGPDRIEAAANANTSGLVFDTAADYLGPVSADIVSILLLTSLFAALLAFHNAIARYLFALARNGIAPASLSNTHDRHASPHIASLTQTAAAVLVLGSFALAGADPVLNLFTWMSGLATVSILTLIMLTGLAILVFFARSEVDARSWNTRLAPALGLVGVLAITALVLTNFTTLISGSGVLAAILLSVVALAFAIGVLTALANKSYRASRSTLHELTS
ncbi:APC family permease [Saccharopolyspora aridisoli]|uniref:APC family permease n=1 Tax=Saccharopolyspora aridisoli TaxID=2530385 RepID=A0A4R4UNQ8_9PSEU|nr:APC family permease [Saccharopolyspora aridisoli]TDC93501.1 APC family permease [Saccharopolyspora aridisoli]